MTAFMGRYTSENDADQRQVARSVGGSLMGVVLRPEDKHGQEEEREVDADIHAKQTSHRDGPASHSAFATFILHGWIY